MTKAIFSFLLTVIEQPGIGSSGGSKCFIFNQMLNNVYVPECEKSKCMRMISVWTARPKKQVILSILLFSCCISTLEYLHNRLLHGHSANCKLA